MVVVRILNTMAASVSVMVRKGLTMSENLKSLGIFKMLVAPLRKGLDAGSQCCARCRSALTSNQPHRFAPNPLDYTDAGDYGRPHLYHPN